MMKASLPSPAESHSVPEAPIAGLGGYVEAALVQVFGSKKAAAIEMQKDRSQLRRQLELGTLMIRELNHPEVLAALGEILTDAFGHAHKTPQQIARERLPELIAVMLAVTQEKK